MKNLNNLNDLFDADKSLSGEGQLKRSETKIKDLIKDVYNVYIIDNETGLAVSKIGSNLSEDDAEEMLNIGFVTKYYCLNYYESGSDFDKRLEQDVENFNKLKD
jgi:hypothetical protein